MDERAAEGGALLHAARELVGPVVEEALEADRAQELAEQVRAGFVHKRAGAGPGEDRGAAS